MGKWKKVKLGDYIEEINDRTTENNQYEVLTSSKNGIFSQEEYFDKQVASKNNIGYKIIKKGQFTYRSMSDSGRFTINRLENKEIGIVSPAYPVFEATKIDPVYLKYYFESELFRKAIHNLSQGSTRTALKYKNLSEIEIILPPIEEQEKIIRILENVDKIISKYEGLLEQKNQFIKSYFVEMFENNKLKKERMIDICTSIVRGPFGSSLKKEFFVPRGENTYKVYEQKNAINSDYKLGEYYIDENKFKELKRFECKPNDIIMSCSGTIGMLYKLPENIEKGVINQALLKFTIDISKISYIYFLNYMKYNIDKLDTKGTGLQNLGSISLIKEMKIPVPTKKEQDKFDRLYQLIDKQKFKLEELIENYRNLKKGLMQQLLTGKVRVKI